MLLARRDPAQPLQVQFGIVERRQHLARRAPPGRPARARCRYSRPGRRRWSAAPRPRPTACALTWYSMWNSGEEHDHGDDDAGRQFQDVSVPGRATGGRCGRRCGRRWCSASARIDAIGRARGRPARRSPRSGRSLPGRSASSRSMVMAPAMRPCSVSGTVSTCGPPPRRHQPRMRRPAGQRSSVGHGKQQRGALVDGFLHRRGEIDRRVGPLAAADRVRQANHADGAGAAASRSRRGSRPGAPRSRSRSPAPPRRNVRPPARSPPPPAPRSPGAAGWRPPRPGHAAGAARARTRPIATGAWRRAARRRRLPSHSTATTPSCAPSTVRGNARCEARPSSPGVPGSPPAMPNPLAGPTPGPAPAAAGWPPAGVRAGG